MIAACPWCSAPRASGPTCPECGAIYAKAQAIKAHGRAPAPAWDPGTRIEESVAGTSGATHDGVDGWRLVENADLELKLRIGAIPIMLLLAMAFQSFEIGRALQRTVLSMPVHELGHAVTAWFCGFSAIPTLWKTLVPETRGLLAPIALLCALSCMMYRAHLAGNRLLLTLGGALIALQAIGTLGLAGDSAAMLIAFGGDGTGMLLATLLMGTFFFGRHTALYTGWLRWGLVAIGAAAFVDMYATWWNARDDIGAVPYGITGGQPSDSMTLIDVHGWSMLDLVERYVALGLICVLALSVVYAWGLVQARQQVKKRQRAARLAKLGTHALRDGGPGAGGTR